MFFLRCLALLAFLLTPLAAQAPGKGLVIVLIGPPGAGKTTQSRLLQKKYKIPAIDVEPMRAASGGATAKLNDLLRAQVIRQDASKGFVLDGYPATRAEAEFLGVLVKEAKLPAPIIIQLDVPDDEVRRRLAGRPEAAKLDKLLADYHEEMDLARSYYPRADIWTVIGTRTPQEVFATIVSLIQDRE